MRALARTTRTRAAALAVITACSVAGLALVATGTAGASSSGKVPRCEKVTVKGKRWGVYVAKGKVGCTAAGAVLKGVLAGKGTNIDNGSSANSYIVYKGWLCPYYQMGIVTCEYATKPVAHASRQIFGLSCSTEVGEPACPARGEP
jgi:hypothetical protein